MIPLPFAEQKIQHHLELEEYNKDLALQDPSRIRTMTIGDVRPREQLEQDQPSSSTMVNPPTQDDEQVLQVEAHDQGGAQDVQVEEEEAPQAPPTQVRAVIQRDHPVDQILGDISK